MKKMIEVKDITFSYENCERILDDINFSIKPGELVLIAGDSGSGKSSILNIINGLIPELIEGNLSGKVFIKGKSDLAIYEKSLIAVNVFQNPRSQFFTNNTKAELVFAMENYAFTYAEMEKRLKDISLKFSIEKLLDRDIFSLSSGERQLLALLTGLIMEPEAVIFDEPSANLDYGNAMRLKRQLMNLKNEGKLIIVADHRCFYLDGLIDRVFLINEGKLEIFESQDAFENSIYGKRDFKLFDKEFFKPPILKSDKISILIKDISYKNILKNISLDFRKNEVTSIVGINGVGKTTLARIISGLIKPESGSMTLDSDVLYIMQDADFQLFGASVLRELEITCKNAEKNENALKLLKLWDFRDRHPHDLSGGQKQRLQLAISLVSDAGIVVLDEPTSGLDKLSMQRVVDVLEILKKEKTIIIISHDYEFIKKSADRIIYIKNSGVEKDFYLEEENIKDLNAIYKEMEEEYE